MIFFFVWIFAGVLVEAERCLRTESRIGVNYGKCIFGTEGYPMKAKEERSVASLLTFGDERRRAKAIASRDWTQQLKVIRSVSRCCSTIEGGCLTCENRRRTNGIVVDPQAKPTTELTQPNTYFDSKTI